MSALETLEGLIQGHSSPRLPGAQEDWVRAIRREAADRFAADGLPAPREEVWRHTPLGALRKASFGRPRQDASEPLNGVKDAVGEAHRFVVSPGDQTPSAAGLPKGLTVRSLPDPSGTAHERLGKLAECSTPGITALNTALFDRGLVIELAPDLVLDRPIHVLHAPGPEGGPTATFPRILVVARSRSRGIVIEHYRSSAGPGESTLTAPVSELFLEAGSQLDHIRLQEDSDQSFHLGRVVAAQQADSRLRSWSFALGGRLARVDIETRLLENGAECSLEGIFVGRGGQHLDHYTQIDHRSPHTTSRESYRGILDDRARGVFLGHIRVQPGAQKTDAQQQSKSIVLSDGARVNMKPWLEIYADDVRCTHGTTVGQLDAEALYYLRSRGLDAAAARAILLQGFARDVLDSLPVDRLRAYLDEVLSSRLGSIGG